MRRIISFLTVMVLVFSLIPQISFAYEYPINRVDLKDLTDATIFTMLEPDVHLDSITNGTGILVPEIDYKVSGDKIIIKKGYLKYYFDKFPKQNLYLNFNFSNGKNSFITFYTGDTPYVNFICSSETYKMNAPADVKFRLDLNGNFITLIKNGEEKLIPRVDFTYSNETQELIIRKSYLAGQFAKSMNQLSLSVGFTGDAPKLISIKPNKDSYMQIAAGPDYFAGVKEDGTMAAWGNNFYGQCDVPKNLAGVKSIASGVNFILALKYDGTVTGWGCNYTDQCLPPKDLTSVKAIAAGGGHSVALKEEGTVVCWGDKMEGQCFVPEGLSKVKAVAAGISHTVALKEDGTVSCWGSNDHGECNIPEGLTGVKAIAAKSYNTAALKEDGTVVVWGDNSYGQCNVPEGLGNIKAIALGYENVAALKEDGTVVVWGNNKYGLCNVPDGLNEIEAIAAGTENIAVIQKDGTLVVWGDRSNGLCEAP
ncbi:MAG TPA: X2-like carbohydrate binding domain-containing protein [Clostridia bacterium]